MKETIQNNNFEPDFDTAIDIAEKVEEVLENLKPADILPELVAMKKGIKGINNEKFRGFIDKVGEVDLSVLNKFEGGSLTRKQAEIFLEEWTEDSKIPKTEKGLLENFDKLPKNMIREIDPDWVAEVTPENIDGVFEKLFDAPQPVDDVESLDLPFDDEDVKPIFNVVAEKVKKKGHSKINKSNIIKLAKLDLITTDDVNKFSPDQICFGNSEKHYYDAMDDVSVSDMFLFLCFLLLNLLIACFFIPYLFFPSKQLFLKSAPRILESP